MVPCEKTHKTKSSCDGKWQSFSSSSMHAPKRSKIAFATHFEELIFEKSGEPCAVSKKTVIPHEPLTDVVQYLRNEKHHSPSTHRKEGEPVSEQEQEKQKKREENRKERLGKIKEANAKLTAELKTCEDVKKCLSKRFNTKKADEDSDKLAEKSGETEITCNGNGEDAAKIDDDKESGELECRECSASGGDHSLFLTSVLVEPSTTVASTHGQTEITCNGNGEDAAKVDDDKGSGELDCRERSPFGVDNSLFLTSVLVNPSTIVASTHGQEDNDPTPKKSNVTRHSRNQEIIEEPATKKHKVDVTAKKKAKSSKGNPDFSLKLIKDKVLNSRLKRRTVSSVPVNGRGPSASADINDNPFPHNINATDATPASTDESNINIPVDDDSECPQHHPPSANNEDEPSGYQVCNGERSDELKAMQHNEIFQEFNGNNKEPSGCQTNNGERLAECGRNEPPVVTLGINQTSSDQNSAIQAAAPDLPNLVDDDIDSESHCSGTNMSQSLACQDTENKQKRSDRLICQNDPSKKQAIELVSLGPETRAKFEITSLPELAKWIAHWQKRVAEAGDKKTNIVIPFIEKVKNLIGEGPCGGPSLEKIAIAYAKEKTKETVEAQGEKVTSKGTRIKMFSVFGNEAMEMRKQIVRDFKKLCDGVGSKEPPSLCDVRAGPFPRSCTGSPGKPPSSKLLRQATSMNQEEVRMSDASDSHIKRERDMMDPMPNMQIFKLRQPRPAPTRSPLTELQPAASINQLGTPSNVPSNQNKRKQNAIDATSTTGKCKRQRKRNFLPKEHHHVYKPIGFHAIQHKKTHSDLELKANTGIRSCMIDSLFNIIKLSGHPINHRELVEAFPRKCTVAMAKQFLNARGIPFEEEDSRHDNGHGEVAATLIRNAEAESSRTIYLLICELIFGQNGAGGSSTHAIVYDSNRRLLIDQDCIWELQNELHELEKAANKQAREVFRMVANGPSPGPLRDPLKRVTVCKLVAILKFPKMG